MRKQHTPQKSAPPLGEPASANDHAEAVFTITELAARWRVDRHQVYVAIHSGRLQAFKVGERQYRIRAAEALRFEQQNFARAS